MVDVYGKSPAISLRKEIGYGVFGMVPLRLELMIGYSLKTTTTIDSHNNADTITVENRRLHNISILS